MKRKEKKEKNLQLLGRGFLLPNHGTTRTFTGSCVGMGSLTAYRQTATMAKPPVATQVHKPFDVGVDLAAQITLDLIFAVNNLSDVIDLFFGKVVALNTAIHISLF
jgi:hypothetical protein